MPRLGFKRTTSTATILSGLLSIASPALGTEHISSVGGLHNVSSEFQLHTEDWALPNGETMGMLGGTFLFNATPKLRFGGGFWAAARGERGGFITFGLAAEVNQNISKTLSANAGVFVGGGGGRGGRNLVGGGLMFRGHTGISYDTGRFGKLGLGVSYITFPSGVVTSTQPYLSYEYSFGTVISDGWNTENLVFNTSQKQTGSERHEFSLAYRAYSIPDDVTRDDGSFQPSSMGLLGAEWVNYYNENIFWKLGADGALSGKNTGYMQLMGAGGYRFAIARNTAIKLHGGAGVAGGGGVDTGGGVLINYGVSIQQNIGKSTGVELAFERFFAPGSPSFKANSIGLKLNHRFGLPAINAQKEVTSPGPYTRKKLRVRMVNQTYLKAHPNWRNRDRPVNNIGVQLDYFLPNSNANRDFFITGQALGAYGGEAGAYMTGLVGAGAYFRLNDRLFWEAEALVGAAGGGGLRTGNGTVTQVNTSLGYKIKPSISVTGTLGRMNAITGDFKANVIGVSLNYLFTGYTGKW